MLNIYTTAQQLRSVVISSGNNSGIEHYLRHLVSIRPQPTTPHEEEMYISIYRMYSEVVRINKMQWRRC